MAASFIPNYKQVRYRGIYAGVDLVFYGNPQELEFDYQVAPHADAAAIRIDYDGARSLALDPEGNLVIRTTAGQIVQHRPRAYQIVSGRRVDVGARYRLSGKHVMFALARYARNRPLVIDPVLVFSTFLGSGFFEAEATGLALDPSGNAYVTGFNVPSLSAQTSNVFIIKMSADGATQLYSISLGGAGGDRAYAIAVDVNGAAWVAGSTTSPTFPTVKPLQSALRGSQNAFITKIAADGQSLIYSTILEGAGRIRREALPPTQAAMFIFLAIPTPMTFPSFTPPSPR